MTSLQSIIFFTNCAQKFEELLFMAGLEGEMGMLLMVIKELTTLTRSLAKFGA